MIDALGAPTKSHVHIVVTVQSCEQSGRVLGKQQKRKRWDRSGFRRVMRANQGLCAYVF
jgi:hypothetical protein